MDSTLPALTDPLSSHISNPSLIIRHKDGSFSVGDKTYLPEIKCESYSIKINFPVDRWEKFVSKKNFNIKDFKFELTPADLGEVFISIHDRGGVAAKYHAISHKFLSVHDNDYYLIVDLLEVVVSNGLVTCRCPFYRETRLIQTDLSHFYCVGDCSIEPTMETIESAIYTLNRAGYGGGRGLWYYDVDFNLVRSFDSAERKVIGRLTPIEAIQIASQLNRGGNWAATKGIGSSPKLSSNHKEIEK